MKSITLLWLMLLCAYTHAQNISDLDAFEKAIKPGTQLTYDYTGKEKQYKLIITIKKVGEELAFDWKTTAPDNQSGTVVMTANATVKSETLQNTFKAGDAKLDNETVLWLSKKLFNIIATTAKASVKLHGVSDTSTVLANTIAECNFNLDGNLVAVPAWELQGGEPKYTLGVLESNRFPLIFKIEEGSTLLLAEIKSK